LFEDRPLAFAHRGRRQRRAEGGLRVQPLAALRVGQADGADQGVFRGHAGADLVQGLQQALTRSHPAGHGAQQHQPQLDHMRQRGGGLLGLPLQPGLLLCGKVLQPPQGHGQQRGQHRQRSRQADDQHPGVDAQVEWAGVCLGQHGSAHYRHHESAACGPTAHPEPCSRAAT
jgi:hypothetical protein